MFVADPSKWAELGAEDQPAVGEQVSVRPQVGDGMGVEEDAVCPMNKYINQKWTACVCVSVRGSVNCCLKVCLLHTKLRKTDMMDLEVAANMRHSSPILSADEGLDPC